MTTHGLVILFPERSRWMPRAQPKGGGSVVLAPERSRMGSDGVLQLKDVSAHISDQCTVISVLPLNFKISFFTHDLFCGC